MVSYLFDIPLYYIQCFDNLRPVCSGQICRSKLRHLNKSLSKLPLFLRRRFTLRIQLFLQLLPFLIRFLFSRQFCFGLSLPDAFGYRRR